MKKIAFMSLILSAFFATSTMAAFCNCAPTKTYSAQPRTIYLNNLNPGTAPDHESVMAQNVTDNTTVSELKRIAREHFTNPDFAKKKCRDLYKKRVWLPPSHAVWQQEIV